MEYTQKQLNESLQRLAKRAETHYGNNQTAPQQVPLARLAVSRDVDQYLQRSRQHAELSRPVSVGQY